MNVSIKKLHPHARAPSYAHSSDAGLDLYAVDTLTLAPHERASVATGIAVAIPDGYVGLVWDKSGLSHTHGIKTLGGVIDSGYRGELRVGLVNLGNEPYSIKLGQKIAQLLIQKVEHAELVVVDVLDETDRGNKGFGSTGR